MKMDLCFSGYIPITALFAVLPYRSIDMKRGYLLLWRCIRDNHFWQDKPFDRARAWIDLLMMANHTDGVIRSRGISIIVLRGQVGTSEVSMSEKWGWSRGKVRRLLKDLSEKGQIEQQNNNVTSLITIVNYETYQTLGTTDSTANSTTDGQQTDTKQYTKKELKNEKKVNKQEESLKALAETVKKSVQPAHKKTDEEWLEETKVNPAYQGINFDIEIGKAQAWCSNKGRKCSRGFLLNWFNKIEKPVAITGQIDRPRSFREQVNRAAGDAFERGEY